MEKPKVIVIAGPTASGKTKLSVELAKKINGEIVSAFLMKQMSVYDKTEIDSQKAN